MPIKAKKVMSKGTSNHIVARTSIQISDLLAPYPMSETNRQRVLSIFASLMRRLLRMQEIGISLKNDYDRIREQVRERGLNKLGKDAVEIPQILELESKAENYLQTTKLALTDCGSLFEPLYGQAFDYRFDMILSWLSQEIGDSHEFVEHLRSHHSWIKQTIDMRNALEHPKNIARGKLIIRNIDIEITESSLLGTDPSWCLYGEEPSSIISDTRILLENTLRLSEEILVSSLEVLYPLTAIVVAEIPEIERDPTAPVRFRLLPKGKFPGA